MMLKANADDLRGNDRYTGFCKDLLDLVANYLNIQYVSHSQFLTIETEIRSNLDTNFARPKITTMDG